MRRTAAMIAAMLALNGGVFAGQAVQSDLSKLTVKSEPITLRVRNAQFADVVALLGNAAGIEIRLAPEVGVTEPITLQVANAKFADAFSLLMTTTKLSYTVVDEKTVLITPKTP
jgi:type II secretory pathway component GspD/PulD (secretin)